MKQYYVIYSLAWNQMFSVPCKALKDAVAFGDECHVLIKNEVFLDNCIFLGEL